MKKPVATNKVRISAEPERHAPTREDRLQRMESALKQIAANRQRSTTWRAAAIIADEGLRDD